MDNGVQKDGGMRRQVTITPDDQVLCRACGCGDFYQPIYIYKVKSPIIGERPIVTIQPNTASMIMCAGCMTPLIPNTLITKTELAGEDLQVDREIKIQKRASAEALRVMKTIYYASEQLGMTPEEFATVMDIESEKIRTELSLQQSEPQGEILL